MSGPVSDAILARERAMVQGFYDRQVGRIVADLRALADRVERGNRTASAVDSATCVISDVMNALPNLPLSLLVQAGRDLDVWKATNGETP